MTADDAVISGDYARLLASGIDKIERSESIDEARLNARRVAAALAPVLAIVGGAA